MNTKPIGIFDSGLGGLTVMSQVMKELPNEAIIYFGDTARIPYGSKSRDAIIKFSGQITKFLLKSKVKMIIVACNTASSLALDVLKKKYKIPVLGVIEPGAKAAIEQTKTGRIGIIGTEGTVNSLSYVKEIRKRNRGKRIYQKACPLFVPLVESGWLSKPATYMIIKEYLKDLKKVEIDTLVLGCTHYPLLKGAIGKVMGEKVKLIDSASATAKSVANVLKDKGLCNNTKTKGKYSFYVSDYPDKFKTLGQRFLGRTLGKVKKVNLDE
ncbi:MAG: glutamate racemase [Elusimicrobia bacterium]|nr:glutamate racemase [Candidatus Liberimonas magnetica]